MAFSFLWWVEQDSNPSVAARTSAAGDGLTEPNYFSFLKGQDSKNSEEMRKPKAFSGQRKRLF